MVVLMLSHHEGFFFLGGGDGARNQPCFTTMSGDDPSKIAMAKGRDFHDQEIYRNLSNL